MRMILSNNNAYYNDIEAGIINFLNMNQGVYFGQIIIGPAGSGKVLSL